MLECYGNCKCLRGLKNTVYHTRCSMALFLIARNVDLDYTRQKECRSKVDALASLLPCPSLRSPSHPCTYPS